MSGFCTNSSSHQLLCFSKLTQYHAAATVIREWTMLVRGLKVPAIPSMIGSTGRVYHFKELIQERAHVGRVWLATTK